jgi:hypothetical protein
MAYVHRCNTQEVWEPSGGIQGRGAREKGQGLTKAKGRREWVG